MIQSYLSQLYGHKKAKEIQQHLEAYIKSIPKQTYRDNPTWYKSANIYVVYPDAISGSKKPLENLIDFLPYIQKTGFNAVHVLPFLDSPMKDRGFDVRDYYTIRKDIGTLDDMIRMQKRSHELGLRLFMDLIFNHVSIEHEWFQKAVEGNEHYRNYFIHTKEKPQFIRKFHKNAAVWAEYRVNGKRRLVNIAFPEFAGEIPHWIHAKDGYWYYHTYRPEQVDINWKNPDVFVECATMLIYWAAKGFHFRLDAIPFVGKSAYKKLNSRGNFTNHLLAALNHLAKQVNPECVFILETYENVHTVIRYLGKHNVQQAELLYGFHLCTSLWVSLVEEDVRHLWKTINEVEKIPTFALWINFLRNHDELSLAYLDSKTLHKTRNTLLQFGKKFREGYGIAGRTFSLLGENKERFLMAYFLLFSLTGGVLLPYGDEYGKKNTPDTHQTAIELEDPRSINRGRLSEKFREEHAANEIFTKISSMIHTRQQVRKYFNTWPKENKSVDSVFDAVYTVNNTSVRVLVNLSREEKKVAVSKNQTKEILSVNTVTQTSDTIILGPYGGIWLQEGMLQ